MFSSFWFWGPLVFFIFVAVFRGLLVCIDFEEDKYFNKGSFDFILSFKSIYGILGIAVAVSVAFFGGKITSIPLEFVAIGFSLIILILICMGIAFIFHQKLPNAMKQNGEKIQFESRLYPLAKAIFTAAYWTLLLTFFIFVIVLAIEVNNVYSKSQSIGPKTETQTQVKLPINETGGE